MLTRLHAAQRHRGAAKILILPAVVCALISAFFVFYFARLLVVSRGLTAVRANGKGAYIGAIAFPVIAFVFGWIAIRLFRRSLTR
jgi:hypothetical protein